MKFQYMFVRWIILAWIMVQPLCKENKSNADGHMLYDPLTGGIENNQTQKESMKVFSRG